MGNRSLAELKRLLKQARIVRRVINRADKDSGPKPVLFPMMKFANKKRIEQLEKMIRDIETSENN